MGKIERAREREREGEGHLFLKQSHAAVKSAVLALSIVFIK